ncbi:hypothetical protein GH714_023518 [Hevea brasiliensis]|uniref:Reverse transcriptase zinc-binding domain-containing protein n=1 Tax=Hevea brasiliensis TaxID=3981 RepID=A0A6A6LCX5_HEVBR|nr:hypothetical protein GH714_023518 [Hevea brasiliensis]
MFSIKSAYEALAQGCCVASYRKWKMIWSWAGPKRISFFWIVLHGRLLTNVERHGRHFFGDPYYPCCLLDYEDLDHELRRCVAAKKFWISLVPANILCNFRGQCGEKDFIRPKDCSNVVISCFREFMSAAEFLADKGILLKPRICVWIRWEPPSCDWREVNTDGSFLSNSNKAAAGGLIRVFLGLQLAWTKGFRRIMLETDRQMVVHCLEKDSGSVDGYTKLELTRDWVVHLHYFYREGNSNADRLAGMGQQLPLGDHYFDVPPQELHGLLLHDVSGVANARNCVM